MSEGVSVQNQELTKLNYQFLMVAQKQIQKNPITAKHQLGMDEATATFLSSMSITDMQKLAESGISAVSFRFDKSNIHHLANYISGDDLAITQAVLGARQ